MMFSWLVKTVMHFVSNIEEVPVVGAKAAGVKAMNLKADDELQVAFICNYFIFLSVNATWKLETCLLWGHSSNQPCKRGLQVLRELKSRPHRVFLAGAVAEQGFVGDLFSTEADRNDQTLLVQSNKGTIYESRLQDLTYQNGLVTEPSFLTRFQMKKFLTTYLKEVFTEAK